MTDIWKIDGIEQAVTNKQILFYAGGSSFPYLGWHYPNKGVGTWEYTDIQKWCYLDELIKESERTRKALEMAVYGLKITMKLTGEIDVFDNAKETLIAIDQIKTITEKE